MGAKEISWIYRFEATAYCGILNSALVEDRATPPSDPSATIAPYSIGRYPSWYHPFITNICCCQKCDKSIFFKALIHKPTLIEPTFWQLILTNLSLSECVFRENSAINDGGGLHIVNSNINLTGCTFVDNSASPHNLTTHSNNWGGASQVYLQMKCKRPTFFLKPAGTSLAKTPMARKISDGFSKDRIIPACGGKPPKMGDNSIRKEKGFTLIVQLVYANQICHRSGLKFY